MQAYFSQLILDIADATENVSWPFIEKQLDLHDWISEEEENETAPVRNLQEWTGISKEMLPPAEMLNDEQVNQLVAALKKMLDAYNCVFVLQTQVPGRIQYEVIRGNLNQSAKLKRWHMGFFVLCPTGTEHKKCALGEHCECFFFDELFSKFTNEKLTPEEERARHLAIEVKHIQRKYGEDWMKYYPYHLDPNYDDENSDPHNYGFDDEEEDADDEWWRK